MKYSTQYDYALGFNPTIYKQQYTLAFCYRFGATFGLAAPTKCANLATNFIN